MNVINENIPIQPNKQAELAKPSKRVDRDDAAVSSEAGAGGLNEVVDTVDIAPPVTETKLGDVDLNRYQELASKVPDTRPALVNEVKTKVANGFYDRPEVMDIFVKAFAEKQEYLEISEGAQGISEELEEVPDEEKVNQIRKNMQDGAYEQEAAINATAEGIARDVNLDVRI